MEYTLNRAEQNHEPFTPARIYSEILEKKA